MWSLLPSHLRDLLKKPKNVGDDESRTFSADVEFNRTVKDMAKKSGSSEEQTIVQLAKSRQQQLSREQENLARWKYLTQREQEVLALVCMGQRNYQIAETLGITHGTVKSHLNNIFEKFGLRNRNDIRLALRDWDFEAWWKNRHELPLSIPAPTTYRSS